MTWTVLAYVGVGAGLIAYTFWVMREQYRHNREIITEQREAAELEGRQREALNERLNNIEAKLERVLRAIGA